MADVVGNCRMEKDEEEEDEDIEALRMAALQSIRTRKLHQVPSYPRTVFQRHQANTNLIAIVPVTDDSPPPPKQSAAPFRQFPPYNNLNSKRVNNNGCLASIAPREMKSAGSSLVSAQQPLKLVLPQDRYCKLDSNTKSGNSPERAKVPAKFLRVEDSDSDESDESESEAESVAKESKKSDEEVEEEKNCESAKTESDVEEDCVLGQDESFEKLLDELQTDLQDSEKPESKPSGEPVSSKKSRTKRKRGKGRRSPSPAPSGNTTRTPSLSPSPDRSGRRYKSPLRVVNSSDTKSPGSDKGSPGQDKKRRESPDASRASLDVKKRRQRRSPDRFLKRSRSRSRSRSPDRFTKKSWSRSPDRYNRTPPERFSKKSPDRYARKSAERYVNRSPIRNMRSRSPDTKRSWSKSPARKLRSRSPETKRSRSPDRFGQKATDRFTKLSPDRHRSSPKVPRKSPKNSPSTRPARSPERKVAKKSPESHGISQNNLPSPDREKLEARRRKFESAVIPSSRTKISLKAVKAAPPSEVPENGESGALHDRADSPDSDSESESRFKSASGASVVKKTRVVTVPFQTLVPSVRPAPTPAPSVARQIGLVSSPKKKKKKKSERKRRVTEVKEKVGKADCEEVNTPPEVDLRTELKRRKAERTGRKNQRIDPDNNAHSARLMQSALRGVVGRLSVKRRPDKALEEKKRKTAVEKEVALDERRVLLLNSDEVEEKPKDGSVSSLSITISKGDCQGPTVPDGHNEGARRTGDGGDGNPKSVWRLPVHLRLGQPVNPASSCAPTLSSSVVMAPQTDQDGGGGQATKQRIKLKRNALRGKE